MLQAQRGKAEMLREIVDFQACSRVRQGEVLIAQDHYFGALASLYILGSFLTASFIGLNQ